MKNKPIKVTFELSDGTKESIECDGFLCSYLQRGKGVTNFWLETRHAGLEYIDACRVVTAMGAVVHDYFIRPLYKKESDV